MIYPECPECGSKALIMRSTIVDKHKVETVVWECARCATTFEATHKINLSNWKVKP